MRRELGYRGRCRIEKGNLDTGEDAGLRRELG